MLAIILDSLGCVIPYRVATYGISTGKLKKKLGLELIEMDDFNCCGLPGEPMNHDMTLTLATRILSLVEGQKNGYFPFPDYQSIENALESLHTQRRLR